MRPLAPLALIATVAAAAPALAAGQATSFPIYKEFKDWQVACDNGGRCEAKGFQKEEDIGDDGKVALIRITRNPGPDGAVTLSLESEQPFTADSLAADGKRLPKAQGWTDAPPNEYLHQWDLKDPRQVASVLAALRNAKTAQLGEEDKAAGTVSLEGMTAALLAMDEAQGRIGTVTALARPGTAPATTVPPGPALPVLAAPPPAPAPLSEAKARAIAEATRTAQTATLKAQDCFEDAKRDSAIALTATEALVQLQCIQGPYQSGYVLFQVPVDDPKAGRPVALPVPLGEATSSLVDPDYNPTAGTLASSARGRGPGDCGDSTVWAFDGRSFQVKSYSRQDSCRGLPGDWPTLWRTAEAKQGHASPAPAASPSAASARPSFDCAKAKSDVEKAICADPALAHADAGIADRYRTLQAALDPAAAAALKQDQGYFVAIRNDGFQEFMSLRDRLDDRLDFLGRVKTGAPAGFTGVWGNVFGEVAIKPEAGGRVAVEIQTVEQTTGRWVCNAGGSAAPTGDTLTIEDSGWIVTLTRRGSLLEVGSTAATDAAASEGQPFCGLNGTIGGTYLALTAGQPD